MRMRPAILTAALGAALASAGTAGATTFEISTQSGETLAGVPFTNGDVVRYDDVAGTTTEIFDEGLFTSGPEDVDAFELLGNGHMLFSTRTSAILGGTFFENADLVDYDPLLNTATIIFFESVFSVPTTANIDAVAVLPNGNLLISTADSETLPGVGAFLDGDVIEWNPGVGTGTLYFSESLFGTDEDIDAFDVTSDGMIVLSTDTTASLPGLSNFLNGDLVLWDGGTASLLFSESTFSTVPADIDAVAIPEPSTAALFALGLVGLALAGRRRLA